MISYSLDIDFIHGDIHDWSCKKLWFFLHNLNSMHNLLVVVSFSLIMIWQYKVCICHDNLPITSSANFCNVKFMKLGWGKWNFHWIWIIMKNICEMVPGSFCKVFLKSSPLNKMPAVSQTIFSDAFSWMKIFVLWLKFHWGLFLRVELTITQHWFR